MYSSAATDSLFSLPPEDHQPLMYLPSHEACPASWGRNPLWRNQGAWTTTRPLVVPGGNDVVESDDESLDGDDSDAESVVSGPGALNALHESISTRTTRQTVDLTQQSVAESFGEGQTRHRPAGAPPRPPAGS